MILEGKLVRFLLSPEGQVALQGLFKGPSIQAVVVEVDELGAWVRLHPEGRAMLIKWDYFATAVVRYEPPPEPLRRVAGFVAKDLKKKSGKSRS